MTAKDLIHEKYQLFLSFLFLSYAIYWLINVNFFPIFMTIQIVGGFISGCMLVRNYKTDLACKIGLVGSIAALISSLSWSFNAGVLIFVLFEVIFVIIFLQNIFNSKIDEVTHKWNGIAVLHIFKSNRAVLTQFEDTKSRSRFKIINIILAVLVTIKVTIHVLTMFGVMTGATVINLHLFELFNLSYMLITFLVVIPFYVALIVLCCTAHTNNTVRHIMITLYGAFMFEYLYIVLVNADVLSLTTFVFVVCGFIFGIQIPPKQNRISDYAPEGT